MGTFLFDLRVRSRNDVASNTFRPVVLADPRRFPRLVPRLVPRPFPRRFPRLSSLLWRSLGPLWGFFGVLGLFGPPLGSAGRFWALPLWASLGPFGPFFGLFWASGARHWAELGPNAPEIGQIQGIGHDQQTAGQLRLNVAACEAAVAPNQANNCLQYARTWPACGRIWRDSENAVVSETRLRPAARRHAHKTKQNKNNHKKLRLYTKRPKSLLALQLPHEGMSSSFAAFESIASQSSPEMSNISACTTPWNNPSL